MRVIAIVSAGVVLCIGMATLGTTWHGIEVSPGVWQDSVSLRQWSVLWITLAIVGLGLARWLRHWGLRLLVPVPLLVWVAWSLRGGGLLPIAFAIYAAPTLVAWVAGLAAGDATRHVARSVKRGSA